MFNKYKNSSKLFTSIMFSLIRYLYSKAFYQFKV